MQMPDPAAKLRGGIIGAEDGLGDSDHRRSGIEDGLRRFQRDAACGAEDDIRPSLPAQAVDAFDPDGAFFGMLGPCLEDRADGKVVGWGFKDAGLQVLTAAEGAYDAIRTNEVARLGWRQISGVDVYTIKLHMINQIGTIIDNQLYLSGG
jgi:hypothetical protein